MFSRSQGERHELLEPRDHCYQRPGRHGQAMGTGPSGTLRGKSNEFTDAVMMVVVFFFLPQVTRWFEP